MNVHNLQMIDSACKLDLLELNSYSKLCLNNLIIRLKKEQMWLYLFLLFKYQNNIKKIKLENRNFFKTDRNMSEEQRSQLKVAPMNQIWNHLSIKNYNYSERQRKGGGRRKESPFSKKDAR